MPHDCSILWTVPAGGGGPAVNWLKRLQVLVEQEDAAQRASGFLVGGWAYWIPVQAEFDAVRDAFLEVCLALDTPVIPGGSWVGATGNAPPFQPVVDIKPTLPVDPNRSKLMGDAAAMVLQVLASDGETRGNHAFYGVHGWMNDGEPFPAPLNQAIALRESLRNALDR